MPVIKRISGSGLSPYGHLLIPEILTCSIYFSPGCVRFRFHFKQPSHIAFDHEACGQYDIIGGHGIIGRGLQPVFQFSAVFFAGKGIQCGPFKKLVTKHRTGTDFHFLAHIKVPRIDGTTCIRLAIDGMIHQHLNLQVRTLDVFSV